MLKQGEIYKLSKHNAYGICGGIIPTDTEILGVRDFTLENIGFHYILFIVNNPSMDGLNAEFYMLATNYDEKDLLDTNINVWKEFSVFMLKWKMLSQIDVCTVDEFVNDIKARGEKYCRKLIQARVGDLFRYNGEDYAYTGIAKPREHIKDFNCHIALLDRNNEVQYVFGVTFLFDFEKIGHIDIPVDDKYLSFEEYKKITGLTWLI